MYNKVVKIELLAAAISGIASHILYFNRGEHHLNPQYYFHGFLGVSALAAVLLHTIGQEDLMQAITNIGSLDVCYLGGLYSSLVTYRLLFHPLNKFPGPIGARLSGFWLSWRFRNRDGYKQVRKLHEDYGLFVRVGPSDLAIGHPKAVELLYGVKSKCIKGIVYDLTKPVVSMQTYRDKSQHDARRRVWSAAFGDNALRGYEQRIRHYRDKMIDQLASSTGKPVNITKLFNMYNFDVMGDLAFGRPFGMLEMSQYHWAIELLNDGTGFLAFMFPTWFFRFLTAIPLLARDWWRFVGFCGDMLTARMKETPDIPDIMSALLAPLKGQQPNKQDSQLLIGDAQLIIAAGSDTTSTTMASILYELLKHPEEIGKLRLELAPFVTDPTGFVLNEKIANLKHLNAVINEVLRLHPPVPTAIHRKTPKEGISIDGTYIPGDMNCWSSQYTLGRSEAIYSEPENFIPERWYQLPEMIKEKSAFAPFSTGPYGCIGKPLALMNIRTTIAQIVMSFDIKFALGEDGTSFEKDAIDHFMLSAGKLDLSFTKRV
ncbi:putative cytochrome P450 [Xylogone sp. PMI_703]|nr:putative cytochrome P450 [Xylogone sp. PMI_703]